MFESCIEIYRNLEAQKKSKALPWWPQTQATSDLDHVVELGKYISVLSLMKWFMTPAMMPVKNFATSLRLEGDRGWPQHLLNREGHDINWYQISMVSCFTEVRHTMGISWDASCDTTPSPIGPTPGDALTNWVLRRFSLQYVAFQAFQHSVTCNTSTQRAGLMISTAMEDTHICMAIHGTSTFIES